MFKTTLTILLVSVAFCEGSYSYGGIIKCSWGFSGFKTKHGMFSVSLSDGAQGYFDPRDRGNPTLDTYNEYDISKGSSIYFLFDESIISHVDVMDHVNVEFLHTSSDSNAYVKVDYIEIIGTDGSRKFYPTTNKLYHDNLVQFYPN